MKERPELIFKCNRFEKEDGMKSEQVGNFRLEESLTAYINLEIEELEPILAPGNTWSV